MENITMLLLGKLTISMALFNTRRSTNNDRSLGPFLMDVTSYGVSTHRKRCGIWCTSGKETLEKHIYMLSVWTMIAIFGWDLPTIHVHTHTHIYIYIYKERCYSYMRVCMYAILCNVMPCTALHCTAMYVCKYVCMHVRMYECMYACTVRNQ